MGFIKSVSLMCVNFWLLWHGKVRCWTSWGPVCFIWWVCIIYFNISRICWSGPGCGISLIDRACDIALSMNLPVFYCAVLYACVIFVISPDTLFMNSFNSWVIMLNCCRIMVDWLFDCAMLFWGVLHMLLLFRYEVLGMAYISLILGRSIWLCASVSLTIGPKVLHSDGSAVVNRTIWIVGQLQSVMLWSSVISLMFILYHWWVSGVTV